MQIDICIEEIRNELELLDELMASHEQLLEKVKTTTPNKIETSAIAAFLHSFYNGIENIFKRVGNRLDESLPSSLFWRQELLELMMIDNPKRSAVISGDLHKKLKPYLGFRHFFRHSYAFQLKWDKIDDLVLELPPVYAQFKKEINIFIDQLTA